MSSGDSLSFCNIVQSLFACRCFCFKCSEATGNTSTYLQYLLFVPGNVLVTRAESCAEAETAGLKEVLTILEGSVALLQESRSQRGVHLHHFSALNCK